jgi:hypothetical protein
MLVEYFTHFLTPCPAHVRGMNYLYEIIAMRSRARRNRAAWQPHLDRTKEYVLSCAAKSEKRGKVVVLGAGLLLDVPLAELSRMFRKVVLIDIVILPEVKKRAQQFANVSILQHDVTNVAQALYESVRQGNVDLPMSVPMVPSVDTETDLVVSLNILSQLWVMPRAYALERLKGIDEERLDDWCGEIVDAHLTYLRSLQCRVCIVADHEFIKRDKDGKMVSRGTTLFGRQVEEYETAWTWNIVPLGEERTFLSKELVVRAGMK